MTGHTKFLLPAAACGMLLVATAGMAQPNPADVNLQTYAVQGNVHMITGAGGNIAVQTGPDGLLVVDTGLASMASKVAAEIQKLSRARIYWIVNTHMHPDHVGGNDALAKSDEGAGVGIFGRVDGEQTMRIIGQANVLNRLTKPAGPGETPPPQAGLPEDEYTTPFKDLRFNNEAVIIYHEPNAHTDGDSLVLFRGSDVIATGDIFTPGGYPFIDMEHGGTLQGEIAALDHILDLTVPGHTQEGGTYVIPGHGRICDEADVVEFRDMVVIVRDRVQDMVRKGMSLDQVKAARPTQDYDTEYVSANSFVKADQFVETVYKSLTKK
jgi:glyoxylase-like metal-dependent hydrolase (beta-lactamase superfamily II)